MIRPCPDCTPAHSVSTWQGARNAWAWTELMGDKANTTAKIPTARITPPRRTLSLSDIDNLEAANSITLARESLDRRRYKPSSPEAFRNFERLCGGVAIVINEAWFSIPNDHALNPRFDRLSDAGQATDRRRRSSSQGLRMPTRASSANGRASPNCRMSQTYPYSHCANRRHQMTVTRSDFARGRRGWPERAADPAPAERFCSPGAVANAMTIATIRSSPMPGSLKAERKSG